MGSIHDWVPDPGSVVSWHASPAALAKAQQAPISAVPASYMQAQHLRGFCEHAARGLDMSRLFIAAWDIAGRCDIRAMTYVINAHLRRHDTYRSWFEYTDAEHIVRRTIRDPADIEFRPDQAWRDDAGRMARAIYWLPRIRCSGIASASRLFSARTTSHSVCALIISTWTRRFSVWLFTEFHMMYAALVGGGAPSRCRRRAAMTITASGSTSTCPL